MSRMNRHPSETASRAPTYQTQWTPPAEDESYNPYAAASSTAKLNYPSSSEFPMDSKYRDEPQTHARRPSQLSGGGSRLAPGPSVRRVDTDLVSAAEKSRAGSRFSPTTPRFNTDFKSWRRDFHGGLWTRGRGINCFFRFCCCTLFITVFLVISIILTLAVYVRPPDITFNDISFDSTGTGSAVQIKPNGLTINLNIGLTVANPNFFSAGFQSINAKALYPLSGQPDTPVGGGTSNNIVFKTETVTTIAFPFAITYTTDIDPQQLIIRDIFTKCGFLGAPKQNLHVKYQLTLKIRIIAFTISPTFNGDANFECPLTKDEAALVVTSLNLPFEISS